MVTVLSFSFAAGNAAGQIYPGEEIQGKMLVEEQAFLANMKEGLQHVQMLAVRDAMKGDYGHWKRYGRAGIKHRYCRKTLI